MNQVTGLAISMLKRVSTMVEQTLKIRLTHNKNTTVYCAAKSA